MSDESPKEPLGPPHAFDEDQLEGARVYAEALINAAEKDGKADEALQELAEVREDIFGRFPEFAAMLASTSVSVERRDGLLKETLGGRALPVVENFLRVLNRHNRLDLLGPIVDQATALLDRRRNRRPVTVRSAVPLDDVQIEAVRGRLGSILAGATPLVKLEVDPALIGGLVIQIGDDLYDMSVRSRLAKLRKQLVEVKAREIRGQGAAFLSA